MKSDLAWFPLFLLLGVLALLTSNPALTSGAVVVLGLGLALLRRIGFPPILVFVFGFQWLQVVTKTVEADLAGAEIQEYTNFIGDLATATGLSLVGLTVLVVGMQLGLRPFRRAAAGAPALGVQDKPPIFWLWCYLAALLAALVMQALSGPLGPVRQPLLAMAALKWAFFTLFTQAALSKRGRMRLFWAAAFIAELGLGTVGFFSDFKLVLFFTLFGVLNAGIRFTGPRLLGLAALGVLTLALAVAWSAVKVEQRRFLAAGEKAQVSTASTVQSFAHLVELVANLDRDGMLEGAELLAERVAYIEYFGRVLDVVPEVIPHEGGELWLDAVSRPFMPRLLFPDKAVIDDTERSIMYAGLAEGPFYAATSISLGYMAEAYIDFGKWLMMPPILVLGWMLGRMYGWLATRSRCRGDIGAALASAVLIQAAYFESSITKVIGGLVVGMLAAWIVAQFVIPRIVRLHRSRSRELTVGR